MLNVVKITSSGLLGAGALAGAMGADEVLFITDVAGIYRSWPDKDSLIHEISVADLKSISESFADGMAPKVKACLDAIDKGAKVVRIIDGRDPNALDLALSGAGGTKVFA